MLVLLPPSEGKTPGADGALPVELSSLSSPELSEPRELVLTGLRAASARSDALEVLGVSAGLATEVARNVRLDTEPTAPAREVYSGVLYAAAGLAELEGAALARAQEHVRTVSALWGLVAPLDRIPAYRLAMGTALPGLGQLAGVWRAPLAEVLNPIAAERLVVDCRSAAYQAAWRPGPTAHAWVGVRVVRDGKVVSHHAKHTRGVLTRHLLTRDAAVPRTSAELLDAARELPAVGPSGPGGWRVLDAALLDGPGHQQTLEIAVG
ncbi:MAG: peroxide stress protein YaaA [Actinomycetales bacterium]|nr:peroxide stress protein YaaA [Actinomycetales bacterium]